MINIAKFNAKTAGVIDKIDFSVKDIKDVKNDEKYGFIITNPPYGERIGDDDNLKNIYNELLNVYYKLDSWSMFVITGYEKSNEIFKKAQKNRKIYNGMIKTYLYQFIGDYKKN